MQVRARSEASALRFGTRAPPSASPQAYPASSHSNAQWSAIYGTDPLAGLTNTSSRQFILGGQVCAWGETMDAASVLSVIWPRAAAAAERLWSNNFATSSASDFSTVNRMAAFRCELLERGVAAPLPGAANAGDMRPAWTVGSCDGGYKSLC